MELGEKIKSRERMRVLVLGDGNFSFSRSLFYRLIEKSIPYRLVIFSSYDSKEEVRKKYPEAKSILATFEREIDIEREIEIEKEREIDQEDIETKIETAGRERAEKEREDERRIRVIHSVDATKSMEYLLSDEKEEGHFDSIIFNFPHIGIENSTIHSSFLGHLLYEIKRILKDDGVFELSLADEQPENWKL